MRRAGARPARIMFTYRMDGCSFGHTQPNANRPAYVSHHNDHAGHNDPTTIENQEVAFKDDSQPNLNFTHKTAYMTDSKDQYNSMYKSTTVGVRDDDGIWRFYLQVRKAHGKRPDRDLSLKGVIPINP